MSRNVKKPQNIGALIINTVFSNMFELIFDERESEISQKSPKMAIFHDFGGSLAENALFFEGAHRVALFGSKIKNNLKTSIFVVKSARNSNA